MNKEIAQKLLVFVNNIDAYKAFQEYVSMEIENCRNLLESAENEQIRGRLQQLRIFQKMREEVLMRKG